MDEKVCAAFESKDMKMRKTLIIFSLVGLGAFTQQAFAEPENCSARFNYCIRGGAKMASFGACSKAEKACEGRNIEKGYKSRDDVKGRGAEGKETSKGGKGGGKSTSDGVTGNGKTTTVVVTDGTGTHTYTVKQGVPIENGQMILAPNGARYHIWDPELGRQLEKAGLVDGKGNAIAYANPKTAKNEYALARDKVVRDRAIASGRPIPRPSGTPRDTPFTKPPTVNDRRSAESKPAAPNSPPPAAAPGTVSTTPVTNPNVMSGAVRDHRRNRN
jgi:hypothetical protein